MLTFKSGDEKRKIVILDTEGINLEQVGRGRSLWLLRLLLAAVAAVAAFGCCGCFWLLWVLWVLWILDRGGINLEQVGRSAEGARLLAC